MRRPTVATRNLLCCLAALLALAACAGGSQRTATHDTPTAPESQPAAPPQLPDLSSPAEALASLPRHTSAQLLSVNGADFQQSLDHEHVAAIDTRGEFSPSFLQPDGATFGGVAFAIYRLNLQGRNAPYELRIIADSPTSNSLHQTLPFLWVGVANLTSNRWDWHPQPDANSSSVIDCGPLNQIASASGEVLIAVAAIGDHFLLLRELSFRSWDESEPNDEIATSNTTGSRVFSGLRGSIGASATESVYDGDVEDYWKINTTYVMDADMTLDLTLDNPDAIVELRVMNTTGIVFATYNSLSLNTGKGEHALHISRPLQGQVQSPTDFPLILRITAVSGSTNYTLSGDYGLFPVAKLGTGPPSGAPPLLVTLAAFNSTDADGSLVSYTYYPDYYSAAAPGNPFTSPFNLHNHTYGSAGVYSAWLLVTDNDGNQAFADAPVVVGANLYDEVENNDVREQATALGGPDTTVRGNINNNGPGTGPRPYDGDYFDNFSFTMHPNEGLQFHFDQAPLGEHVVTGVWEYDDPDPGDPDLMDNFLFLGNNDTDAIFSNNQEDAAPDGAIFYLELSSLGTAVTDYKFSMHIGQAPVVDLQPPGAGGPAPLNVNFIASATDADDAIVKYEWDWEGDGIYDAETTVNTNSHDFMMPCTMKVRVTDEAGFSTLDSSFINPIMMP